MQVKGSMGSTISNIPPAYVIENETMFSDEKSREYFFNLVTPKLSPTSYELLPRVLNMGSYC